MANRSIPIITKLDALTSGSKLYADSSAHPQGKTGWNEAANSMNGLHAIGTGGYQAHSMRLNYSRIPVVGNYGNSFTEESVLDIYGQMELPGGYDRVLIFGQTDCTNNFSVNQKVEIYLDGVLYKQIPNIGVFNFYYNCLLYTSPSPRD